VPFGISSPIGDYCTEDLSPQVAGQRSSLPAQASFRNARAADAYSQGMPWYAHAWSVVALVIAIALVIVLAAALAVWSLVFALLVGLAIFLLARRWASRRLG
jgi:hypothetical protein